MAQQSSRAGSGRVTATAGASKRNAGVRRRVREEYGSNVTFGIPLRRENLIGIAAGILIIILGYVLMATAITDNVAANDGIWNNFNAVTLAPILLTIGYCIVIPLALLYRPKKVIEEDDGTLLAE